MNAIACFDQEARGASVGNWLDLPEATRLEIAHPRGHGTVGPAGGAWLDEGSAGGADRDGARAVDAPRSTSIF